MSAQPPEDPFGPGPGQSTGSGRRDGDVLAGPADSTRPRNPWPRLLAFAATVIGMIVLAGLCVASFASAPAREVSVRFSEVQPGTPRFIPITHFGHDEARSTYGAYLAIPLAEGAPRAYFSRDTESGCNLRWEAGVQVGDERGVFVDPCSEARYAFDGRALHEGALHDLHTFVVRREALGYVVSFEVMTLGACRDDNHTGCSAPGVPAYRSVPRGELPAEFGTR